MKIFDTIGAAFRGPKAPDSTKIAGMLSEAESAVATAREKLGTLEAQRAEKSIAGDKERSAYRAALNAARDDIADGEALIETLRERHASAVAAESEDGRKATYKAAKIEADKLAGLIDDYAKAAQAVRGTIRRIAEIDSTVQAANTDLPAGTIPLSTSGKLRSVPAVPREILSEKVVDLWLRPGSNDPLPDDYQKTVTPQPNGTGTFPRASGEASTVDRGRFTRREVRESQASVHAVGFDKIALPDAYAAPPKAERQVVIEHVPVRTAAA